MQCYIAYLYLETTLHVSGSIVTHYQERKQLYLQYLVFVVPLLLSATIVEGLEPVWVCCGWPKPPTAQHSTAQTTVSTVTGICHAAIVEELEPAWVCCGWPTPPTAQHKQLYLKHLVFAIPLLLSAAIVEELEPVWGCCVWRRPPTAHSNRFQLFHDSGR